MISLPYAYAVHTVVTSKCSLSKGAGHPLGGKTHSMTSPILSHDMKERHALCFELPKSIVEVEQPIPSPKNSVRSAPHAWS